MTAPAQANTLLTLRGETFWRPVGSTGAYKPFFNAVNVALTLNVVTQEQLSNGNTPGVLDFQEVSRAAKVDFTLQSRHKSNLEKFLLANSVVVAAETSVSVTLPVGVAGDMVYLGVGNVTSATLGSLVESVDYTLNRKTGSVIYLKDQTAAVTGTVGHGDFNKLGVFSGELPEVEIMCASEKAGHMIQLFRVKLAPTAAYELVKDGNGWATAQLTGTLLIDTNAPMDGALGQYGRVTSIS